MTQDIRSRMMKPTAVAGIAIVGFLVGLTYFNSRQQASTARSEGPSAQNSATAAQVPDSSAEWNFTQGVTADQKKDYDLAVSYFSESLRLRPHYIPAIQKRGRARLCTNDYEGAHADAREVIRLASHANTAADGYELRGWSYHS